MIPLLRSPDEPPHRNQGGAQSCAAEFRFEVPRFCQTTSNTAHADVIVIPIAHEFRAPCLAGDAMAELSRSDIPVGDTSTSSLSPEFSAVLPGQPGAPP